MERLALALPDGYLTLDDRGRHVVALGRGGIGAGLRYWADVPDSGLEGFRVLITLLFPTGGR